jgi:phospholipase C
MKNSRRPPNRFDPRRRQFLAALAGGASAAVLSACDSSGPVGGSDPSALPPLPDPATSGIDHIVVVMMENRSFDHFLGWVPGADGIQAGMQYPDKNGVLQSTFRLSDLAAYGFQGCGKEDPSHSYTGGHDHFNNGKMDAFLQTVADPADLFPIGYYTADDVPFFKGAAQHFTICDRYFSGILSSTFPNRVYMHSGQTDRNSNTLPIVQQAPSELPTIWDLLGQKSRAMRYYFFDLPITGLWGVKYLTISGQFEQFLIDASLGHLPDVAFVDPFFGASVGESPFGVSRDDHPQADIRDGQAFLNQIYDALRNSPQWDKTLLIINYDEWGGFYDHVPPPLAPVTDAERDVVGNDGRLGFRVPAAIIGPRARRGHVSHHQFDPNSILNFIRWRFDLGSLSPRDTTSLNLAYALDFANPPNLDAPSFNVPTSLTGFGTECVTSLPFPLPNIPTAEFLNSILDPALRSQVEHIFEIQSLRNLMIATGWPI